MASAEWQARANQAFRRLGDILDGIRIQEAKAKATPPVLFGYMLDTILMRMELEPTRLAELLEELNNWLGKNSATKKELQQLIGKLNFASITVKARRLFFSKIITFMKAMPSRGRRMLSLEVKKDIKWWAQYMQIFDGRAPMVERYGCSVQYRRLIEGLRGVE